MYYLLVFVGLVGVAVIVAMSPLMIRLIQCLLPVRGNDGPQTGAVSPQSIDRSEIRDEIRRLTAALEMDRRGTGRTKGLQ